MKTELDLSLGGITWCDCSQKLPKSFYTNLRWGFSPWTPLSGERVLVIGAGDPRHLIKTLASQSDMEKCNKLEFYLWEQSAHVYCRQVITSHTCHAFSM